jgi:hypothetical protein
LKHPRGNPLGHFGPRQISLERTPQPILARKFQASKAQVGTSSINDDLTHLTARRKELDSPTEPPKMKIDFDRISQKTPPK